LETATAQAVAAPKDRDAQKQRKLAQLRWEATQKTITRQVGELPLTVNLVAEKQPLISAVLTAHWWSTCNDPKLREAAEQLAPMMRFRERRSEEIVKLDISDLLAIKEVVEFGPEHERLTTSAYQDRVEQYVLALAAENPVLQKLKAGHDLTQVEVKALAELLASHDPYVTEELLRKVYDHKTARFMQFIKHILGLERLASWTETVTAAFDQFIAEHNTLTSMQIQFLQTLRTFVLQTGRVEKKDLIEAPFTQIHPKGVRGVFQANEIKEILAFTERLVA
jgi:type I restriction enzyme, R subunit